MQQFLVFCASVVIGVRSLSVGSNLDLGYDNQCGVEESTNLIHHNPWLVFLEYYSDGSRESIRCGATLIGSRHLITAAHCVNKYIIMYNRLVARLGDYDIYSEKDCVGGVCADAVVRITVAKVFTPPGFDGMEDDIAILELEENAPYTDFIRPICLPTGELKNDVMYSAAGWGELPYNNIYSHIKKIIPLPTWSTEDCRNVYKYIKLPQKIICAGGEEGIDTCRGDSGGPLTLNKGRVELRGVTSLGNVHCGMKGSPGIYTSVSDHLEWIKKVLSGS